MMATRTNTCFMREAIFALVISFKSISFIMGLVFDITKVIHLGVFPLRNIGETLHPYHLKEGIRPIGRFLLITLLSEMQSFEMINLLVFPT